MTEAVDLGAENDERMARLREALALGHGFQLVIVQIEPGEQREEVLRRLSGWAGRNGVPRLDLVRVAKGESPVMRLMGEHDGVILVGLEEGLEGSGATITRLRRVARGDLGVEEGLEDSGAAIGELNWSRDRLPELVHGPLVLVVSQRVQTALFERAPDLYSWRTHSTNISLQPGAAWPAFQWRDPDPDPENPAALEAMIEEVTSLRPLPVLELARLHERLARARSARGEISKAEAAFDAAYDEYARAGTAENRVALLLRRCVMERSYGRFDTATSWLDRARREAAVSEALPPHVAAHLTSESASLAFDRGDLDTAESELQRAVAAFRSLGDYRREALFVAVQAMVAFRRGDTQQFQTLIEQWVDLYHREGGSQGDTNALIVLAIQNLLAGRSDDAERLGVTAVERAEASGSVDTVAFARATLGRIALANHHWELGELAAESLVHGDTASELGGNAELAEVRGRLALRRGEQTSAAGYLQAAQEAYRRRGRVWRVADVSLELGKLGRRTRNWTLALTSFETGATLGDPRQRAVAALGLAQLAFDRGERTPALADQLAVATQKLVAAGDATLADTARELRGIVLLALDRDVEAREELEAAQSGFETRGQAERAARVQDLLATRGYGEAAEGR